MLPRGRGRAGGTRLVHHLACAHPRSLSPRLPWRYTHAHASRRPACAAWSGLCVPDLHAVFSSRSHQPTLLVGSSALATVVKWSALCSSPHLAVEPYALCGFEAKRRQFPTVAMRWRPTQGRWLSAAMKKPHANLEPSPGQPAHRAGASAVTIVYPPRHASADPLLA